MAFSALSYTEILNAAYDEDTQTLRTSTSGDTSTLAGLPVALGQAAASGSIPVVLASDQELSGSFTITGGSISGDVTISNAVVSGVSVVPGRPTTAGLSRAIVSFSSSGDHTLVAGVSGQTIRMFRLLITLAGTANVILKSGSTPLTGSMALAANGGLILDFNGEPWFVTGATEALVMNTSESVVTGGAVWYTQS